MNIPRLETAEFRFYANIYATCVERMKAQGYLDNSLGRGTKVLSDEVECDRYLAFYGGHHFHKLYEAFKSTEFQRTQCRNLEVFDWGCGQAVATCILIDYLIEKNIHPNLVSITLIEPSYTALQRGYYFTRRILENRPSTYPNIITINKYLDDLTISDIVSHSNNLKLHLFSNILDVEAFDLHRLYELITSSFQGVNRFICTSPRNHRHLRLDDFYRLFSESWEVYNHFETSQPIQGKVFYVRNGEYQLREISRHEKQFSVKLPRLSND